VSARRDRINRDDSPRKDSPQNNVLVRHKSMKKLSTQSHVEIYEHTHSKRITIAQGCEKSYILHLREVLRGAESPVFVTVLNRAPATEYLSELEELC